MRFTHVHVQNLFSFEDLRVDLEADTTVILGPNGSGKTNMLRALDLAATALRWAAEEPSARAGVPQALGPAGRALAAYWEMSHLGRGGERRVRVGLRLDLDDEKGLVVAFLRAALAWSIRDELRGAHVDTAVESWVTEGVTEQRVASLFEPELVAEHSGVPGRSWQVGLDFQLEPDGPRYRWVLAGPPLQNCIVALDSRGRPLTAQVPFSSGLLQNLFGFERVTPPPPMPDPLPSFHLGMLVNPAPCGPVALGGGGRTLIDWSVPPVLDFLTRFAAARPPEDLLGTEPGWSLAVVLQRIWQEKVFVVAEQLRGIGPWGRSVPAAGTYDLDQLALALTSTDPHLLPARLCRLASGDAAEREHFRLVQDTFGALAGGRSVAVRVEPQPASAAAEGASSGGETSVPEQGRVFVDLLVTDGARASAAGVERETPVQFCGAGTWEALVLAEALCAPTGRVVLLDEPAANLHPSWQQALRDRLIRAGTQALVVTHAGAVVPLAGASAMVALVRLRRKGTATEARRIEPSEVARVGRKLEAKGNMRLLFVERAVLAEGQDDLDVVRILARRLNLDLEGPDSAVLECGSRENLPDYIRLCHKLDIVHLVIMDADSTKAKVNESVQKNAQAVRDAVRGGCGRLFEFEEAIEQAFGLERKDPARLRQAAEKVPLQGVTAYPEVQKLCQVLSQIQ